MYQTLDILVDDLCQIKTSLIENEDVNVEMQIYIDSKLSKIIEYIKLNLLTIHAQPTIVTTSHVATHSQPTIVTTSQIDTHSQPTIVTTSQMATPAQSTMITTSQVANHVQQTIVATSQVSIHNLTPTLEDSIPQQTISCNASPTSELNIDFVIYSPKSLAVIGESTKSIKKELKKMGGRYSAILTLENQPVKGWLFSHSKQDELSVYLGKSVRIPSDKHVMITDDDEDFVDWFNDEERFYVIGVGTKSIKSILAELGGRFCMNIDSKLGKIPGWIFSIDKKDLVLERIAV